MERLFTSPEIWAAVAALLALIPFFRRKFLEKQSTNKAILAEVRRRTVIAEHREFRQACIRDKTTEHHLLIPFSYTVYTRQIANIGTIEPSVVAKVVQFYGYVDFLNAFQSQRKHYVDAGHSEEFNQLYVGALTRILKDFDHAFCCAFKRMGLDSDG